MVLFLFDSSRRSRPSEDIKGIVSSSMHDVKKNVIFSSTLLFNLFVSFSVCNTRDAPMYFCERIYKSMAYYPPDYSGLIRDIVSRSEVSKLNQNKRLYLQRKTSLSIRMCSSFFGVK